MTHSLLEIVGKSGGTVSRLRPIGIEIDAAQDETAATIDAWLDVSPRGSTIPGFILKLVTEQAAFARLIDHALHDDMLSNSTRVALLTDAFDATAHRRRHHLASVAQPYIFNDPIETDAFARMMQASFAAKEKTANMQITGVERYTAALHNDVGRLIIHAATPQIDQR